MSFKKSSLSLLYDTISLHYFMPCTGLLSIEDDTYLLSVLGFILVYSFISNSYIALTVSLFYIFFFDASDKYAPLSIN